MKNFNVAHKAPRLVCFLSICLLGISCEKNTIENLDTDQVQLLNKPDTENSLQKNTTLADRFQYFHRGNNKQNIYSSSSTTGTGNWSSSRRVPGTGLTNSSISVAQFGSRVAVAYRGRRNTGKIYYALSNDGNNFGPERTVPGALTSGTLHLTEFNGQLFLYHRGRTSGNNQIYVSSFNGSTWSTNRKIVNAPVYNDFDLVTINGVLYLIAINSSEIVVQASRDGINFNNVSRQLFRFPVGTRYSNPVSFSITKRKHTNTNSYYAVVNTDSNEIFSISSTDLQSFSTLRKITINNGSPIKSDESISIATNGTQLVVAYEAESSNDVLYSFSNNGTNWTQQRGSGSTSRSGLDILYIQ